MIRFFSSLLTIALACYGFWFVSHRYPDLPSKISEHLDLGQFYALETKYSAGQLMDKHRRELLGSNQAHYLAPVLEFYPYALMEIKYAPSQAQTKEALLLWDLTDGEVVLNTKYWDKTHGFADCLAAGAGMLDFKILHFLSSKGGMATEEALLKAMYVDLKTFKQGLNSCLKKKLIIQNDMHYRLHFQNPKLRISPETQLVDKLLIKPLRESSRLCPYFSISQVEKMANCAFGEGFTIRKTSLVYLPVHSLILQHKDGSVQTTLWNGLSGRPYSQN
ncbi:MAG: hypothetical protein QRY72_05180 [Candidatus Rhabdochlamydia sp.]